MEKIICLGDSISDSERLFSENGLGYGYINQLHSLLMDAHIPSQITNRGINGFTVKRVLDNAKKDCSMGSPDVVTILVGVNDVGLMMNTNRTVEQQQDMLREFGATYRKLLDTVKSCVYGDIILMEPFIFPYPQEYAQWIPLLADIQGQIGDLAQEFGCPYVLLHDRLNKAAQEKGYDAITTDGIHLTKDGHEIIARALFEELKKHMQ